MRKRTAFLFVALMTLTAYVCVSLLDMSRAFAATPSFLLLETETGQVISEDNADATGDPAGVSKLMSWLLFMEALDSGRVKGEDTVAVSPSAAAMGGTSVFLDAGASYPFSELLKASVVCSANDATVALAEKLSGSEEAFVAELNARAKELGLSAAFINCTGLAGNSLSARDAALIARELARHPSFFTFSSVFMDTFTHNSGRTTEMVSANKLLRQLSGCDGMATGSSASGGYDAVVSLKSGAARYIAVVFGEKNSSARFFVASEALKEAEATYTVKSIAKAGGVIKKNYPVLNGDVATVNIYAEKDCALLLKKGESVDTSIELSESIAAPVEAGAEVGKLVVSSGGKKLAELSLTVRDAIGERTFASSVLAVLRAWINM